MTSTIGNGDDVDDAWLEEGEVDVVDLATQARLAANAEAAATASTGVVGATATGHKRPRGDSDSDDNDDGDGDGLEIEDGDGDGADALHVRPVLKAPALPTGVSVGETLLPAGAPTSSVAHGPKDKGKQQKAKKAAASNPTTAKGKRKPQKGKDTHKNRTNLDSSTTRPSALPSSFDPLPSDSLSATLGLVDEQQLVINETAPAPERRPARKKGRPEATVEVERPSVVCKFFLEGRCRKGADCPFSHDAEPVKKTEVCKFFLSGSCTKFNDCVYSHDLKQVPCRFFAAGHCSAGAECRFNHDMVTMEKQEPPQTVQAPVAQDACTPQPSQAAPPTVLPKLPVLPSLPPFGAVKKSDPTPVPAATMKRPLNFLDPFASPF